MSLTIFNTSYKWNQRSFLHDYPISLSIMSSKCVYVMAYGRASLFFKAERYFILRISIHLFYPFIYGIFLVIRGIEVFSYICWSFTCFSEKCLFKPFASFRIKLLLLLLLILLLSCGNFLYIFGY